MVTNQLLLPSSEQACLGSFSTIQIVTIQYHSINTYIQSLHGVQYNHDRYILYMYILYMYNDKHPSTLK